MTAPGVPIVRAGGGSFRLHVFDLGLACCAVEVVAAALGGGDAPAALPLAAGPASADVMVVAGTVTDKMAPAVRRLYDAMPQPRYVMSFGACSNTGGPYWDSYCVIKGVDRVVPVDVYVPGCPPRPEALLQGLTRLQEHIDAGRPPAGAGR